MTDQSNTVLLPVVGAEGFRAVRTPDGGRHFARDLAYFPYVNEDPIRYSAAQIAVTSDSRYYDALGLVPTVLRDRVLAVTAPKTARLQDFPPFGGRAVAG